MKIMCTEILFKSKNIEVTTAGELLDITGFLIHNLLYREDSAISLTHCLCQVDVPATLKKAGFSFEYNKNTGDYIVD